MLIYRLEHKESRVGPYNFGYEFSREDSRRKEAVLLSIKLEQEFPPDRTRTVFFIYEDGTPQYGTRLRVNGPSRVHTDYLCGMRVAKDLIDWFDVELTYYPHDSVTDTFGRYSVNVLSHLHEKWNFVVAVYDVPFEECRFDNTSSQVCFNKKSPYVRRIEEVSIPEFKERAKAAYRQLPPHFFD